MRENLTQKRQQEKCPNLERQGSLPWQPRIAPERPNTTLYVVLNDSTIKRKYQGEKNNGTVEGKVFGNKELSSGGTLETEVNLLSLKLYFFPHP